MDNYEVHISQLKTGDLVFFHNKGAIAKVISAFQKSKYNHVGIVWVNPEDNEKYIFESTKFRKNKDGVIITRIEEAVDGKLGKNAIRYIKNPLTTEQVNIMNQFVEDTRGIKYEKNYIELMASTIDIVGQYRGKKNKGIFCSELLVMLFKQIGFFNKDVIPNEFTPADLTKMELYFYEANIVPVVLKA